MVYKAFDIKLSTTCASKFEGGSVKHKIKNKIKNKIKQNEELAKELYKRIFRKFREKIIQVLNTIFRVLILQTFS